VGIEWSRVGEALRRADWRYLFPAGAALVGYLLARSARWRVLLGSDVRLNQAFWVTNVGYLISNILPFRLGDPARAVAIGLDDGVKISTALSTVVVERVLDMLTVVILLAVTVPFVSDVGWTREAGLLGAGMGTAAMAVMVLLALRPEWGRRVVARALSRVSWIDREQGLEWFDGLLEGLTALGSVRSAAALIGWSLATWTLTVAHYLAMMRAFTEEPSVVAASFLTCATALGVALPSSPGAMGVFHSVARYALQLPFDVPAETAVVIAFASHAVQYIGMCALGVVGLLRQNLSIHRLRSQARVRAAKVGPGAEPASTAKE
jgi:hypothetical protein